MSSGRIIPCGPRHGAVEVPKSKSHLHRVLIADFLAGGHMFDSNDALSDDVIATCRCLAALSSDVETPTLDCGESGSTLRFLLPVAAALGSSVRYVASGRLPERPISPFLDLLRSHGAETPEGERFPLLVSGKLSGGHYSLRGDISSQIISGLIFALPMLPCDSEIELTTPLESRGYVDMTLGVVRKFGIRVTGNGGRFRIPGGQKYMPRRSSIEGCWSSAAFWLAMNYMGSDIKVRGLSSMSSQPDRAFAGMLDGIGSEIDVSQSPDTFPALAVAAASRPLETRFFNAGRLRLKESDRLVAMARMLSTLGVRVNLGDDYLVVAGSGELFEPTGTISTFGDHRIAMAAAAAATYSGKALAIDNAGCVSKSYPGFFDAFESLI